MKTSEENPGILQSNQAISVFRFHFLQISQIFSHKKFVKSRFDNTKKIDGTLTHAIYLMAFLSLSFFFSAGGGEQPTTRICYY